MSEGGLWLVVFAYLLGSLFPAVKVCHFVGDLLSARD